MVPMLILPSHSRAESRERGPLEADVSALDLRWIEIDTDRVVMTYELDWIELDVPPLTLDATGELVGFEPSAQSRRWRVALPGRQRPG